MRRQKASVYSKKKGLDENQLREEQEVGQIGFMLDNWHRIQMARKIEKETDDKNLSDTILEFAKPTQKVTETR